MFAELFRIKAFDDSNSTFEDEPDVVDELALRNNIGVDRIKVAWEAREEVTDEELICFVVFTFEKLEKGREFALKWVQAVLD